MAAIETLVNLLPMICANYQQIKLISQLNIFFSFDHNIFLLHSSVEPNCFLSTSLEQGFTPQSVYTFTGVADNITGLEMLEKIQSKNTFMIVVPESSKFEDNLKLLAQVKEIQRLQINMKIAMFFSHVSRYDLQSLFRWNWKHQIINVIVTYEVHQASSLESSLNIFTFNPFESFDVINVTGSESFDNFFLSQRSNFQQHPIVLGMGKSFHYRSDEYLWLAVFGVMNASYTKVKNKNKLSFENGIDIIPDLQNQMDIVPDLQMKDDAIRIKMYPIYINSVVLVVPEALEYSEFAAYLQTITSDSLFGYCLMIIASVILLLSIFRYIKHVKMLLFESIASYNE